MSKSPIINFTRQSTNLHYLHRPWNQAQGVNKVLYPWVEFSQFLFSPTFITGNRTVINAEDGNRPIKENLSWKTRALHLTAVVGVIALDSITETPAIKIIVAAAALTKIISNVVLLRLEVTKKSPSNNQDPTDKTTTRKPKKINTTPERSTNDLRTISSLKTQLDNIEKQSTDLSKKEKKKLLKNFEEVVENLWLKELLQHSAFNKLKDKPKAEAAKKAAANHGSLELINYIANLQDPAFPNEKAKTTLLFKVYMKILEKEQPNTSQIILSPTKKFSYDSHACQQLEVKFASHNPDRLKEIRNQVGISADKLKVELTFRDMSTLVSS